VDKNFIPHNHYSLPVNNTGQIRGHPTTIVHPSTVINRYRMSRPQLLHTPSQHLSTGNAAYPHNPHQLWRWLLI